MSLRRFVTSLGFLLAGVVATTCPSRAHARGAVQVKYTYPEGDPTCPDEAALRGMIASQLGYEPFAAASATRVDASIDRTAGRLRGLVVLTRDGVRVGERAIEAANDCASVASALALTVAVAIDTLDSAQPSGPVVAPAPPPAKRAEPSVEAPPPAHKPPQSAPTPAFRLSGAPNVSAGFAPAAALGGAISVGARWPGVSLGLEARGDLPAYAPLSSGGQLGASAVVGMLAPCAHVRRFVLCGLFAAGSMRGESRGVASASSDYGLFGLAGARVGFEIALSRSVAMRPQVDGFVAWARPGLQFNNRTVWTAPPVAGTLGLAFVVELGGTDRP